MPDQARLAVLDTLFIPVRVHGDRKDLKRLAIPIDIPEVTALVLPGLVNHCHGPRSLVPCIPVPVDLLREPATGDHVKLPVTVHIHRDIHKVIPVPLAVLVYLSAQLPVIVSFPVRGFIPVRPSHNIQLPVIVEITDSTGLASERPNPLHFEFHGICPGRITDDSKGQNHS